MDKNSLLIKTYEAQMTLSSTKVDTEVSILNIKIDKLNEKVKDLEAKKLRSIKYYSLMIDNAKHKILTNPSQVDS